MPRFLLLLFVIQFLFSPVAAQTKTNYYCPPCNCKYDGNLFAKPGRCPDVNCNMELLPVTGEYQKSKITIWMSFLKVNFLLKIYDILILPSIIQGIILSLILMFRLSSNRQSAFFLACIILALALQNIKFYYILNVLVQHITNTSGNPEYHLDVLSHPLSGILFIGPMLYFYVKSLSTSDFKVGLKDIVHFIPGTTFIIINSLIFYNVLDLGMHSSRIRWSSILSSAENTIAIVLAFYYIFLSFKLIRTHDEWVRDHYSTTAKKSLNWLKYLIRSLSIIWLGWLFAVVINLFTQDFILTYLSSYPFQIASSIIIFWIGYMGFIQGEMFSAELSYERKGDKLSILVPKESDNQGKIKEMLLNSMAVEKMFLTSELSLTMLANQLKISPKSISTVLNSELDKNFHDFINDYRVEEVKRRLRDPQFDHLTILAIAMDSGFNSKSSFNRIFMKTTGMSPKEFKLQDILS